ncbi:MAG: ATP-binding protein [Bacteroidetes bacterium]|nr:ATP-binding protein [Bacteroidota bacterium]
MRLLEVTIQNFRNIIDSTPVRIQDDITCIVGKNESGKTAFLHALYRLNPARQNANFKVEDQYPAWLEKKDRMRGINIDEFRPVKASFEISNEMINELEKQFGPGIFQNNILTLERAYNGTLYYQMNIDEKGAIKNLFQDLSFTRDTRAEMSKANNIVELKAAIEACKPNIIENEKDQESITELTNRIKARFKDKDVKKSIWDKIEPKIPKFIYFDKYSSLPYSVKIKQLLEADPMSLEDDKLTALSLLRMAGADDEYLLNPDYERRKRELENVANALTTDVLKYWSQNRELRVSPDITQRTENKNNGTTAVIDELKIRIWDNKHALSLPFNEHSSGFQWFFSFLAAFSEYEYSDEPVIILLDEPGLGLHGRAQADFLLFIEERLAEKRQVIYSTHSPFMVQPDHLERARIVEEKDREAGSKITEDVLTTDPDTLFPLQGALGYDLVQHLFINKNNLVLEGTSDFIYLTIFSDFLKENKRKHLNDKWSLVPVGGADLIPTFVALLGNHLDITVVLDSRKEGNQKLGNLSSKGYLKDKRIITIGEILTKKLADIEDLFNPTDYLTLYNKAFNKSHKPQDLQGEDQIVNKIARLEKIDRFDHGKPADFFLRNKAEILTQLSEQTFSNFEKLIEQINKTLGK